MADSFIQLPADSTGKKVDTRTEATNSEHREVHIIGDPSTNEGVAVVTNVDPAGEVYGVVVRDPNSTTIASSVGTVATNTTTLVAGIKVQDSFASTVTSHQFNTDFRGLDVFIGGTFGTTVADYQSGDNRLKVDGSAVTQPVSGTVAATQSGAWDVDNSGTFAIQVQDSQASTITSHQFNTDFRGLDTYIGGAAASTFSELLNPDGRVKVELPAAAIAVSKSGTWAIDNPVAQGDAATALRVVVAGNSDASVSATQVGTWNIGTVTTVTGITNSLAASLVDSSGVQYSGSNPVPVTGTVAVTKSGTWAIDNPVNQGDAATALRVVVAGNSDASVSATQVGTWNIGTVTTVTTVTGVTNTVNVKLDSADGGYTTANPFPITIASGALTSTISVGDTLHDAADIGAAPVKVGGVAMATNPTAVADGDRVNFRADDLGRQLIRNVQVRDLIATAYVTLTNGTEATFLAAGGAGVFLDCISVLCANQSSAAVNIDFRSVTAGNVEFTVEVPAGGPGGITHPVPWPQSATNNNWTVDMPDITGTTINIAGLFSKEV